MSSITVAPQAAPVTSGSCAKPEAIALTSGYEPSTLEVGLTLALGNTLLRTFYARYVASLGLRGDERVLDFGSGSGVCARHVARRLTRGGHLTCLDVSARWLSVARRSLRRHSNVRCILGHATTVALPDDCFDLVMAHYALHDVPPAERALVFRRLAARLAPGGRLALRDPLMEWPDARVQLDALAAACGLRPVDAAVRRYRFAGAVFEAVYVRPGRDA